MKTFDKIEEVSINIKIFIIFQFHDEINKDNVGLSIIKKNINNVVDNNTNYFFKNDLEEIKDNFIKIKTMISQKRKPEEKEAA